MSTQTDIRIAFECAVLRHANSKPEQDALLSAASILGEQDMVFILERANGMEWLSRQIQRELERASLPWWKRMFRRRA